MSMETIYAKLVQAGMSPVGACAMMGNMQAESALKSNNVEDRFHRDCGMTDEQYTAMVDAGGYDFARDNGNAYGYGLCQWTYSTRKAMLLRFAKDRGVSIGDEAMQVDFCVHELRTEYPALWLYLCDCTGVYEAAERICKEYERPAINNVDERAQSANSFYMTLGGSDVPMAEDKSETAGGETTMCNVSLPVLRYGNKSGYVAAGQALLNMRGYNCGEVDGDFGSKTKKAVEKFQKKKGLNVDGVIGMYTWAALHEGR